ncbi:hypothetical protein PSHT_15939 [Puccinia striiformis]|uniref:HAT C-terminal dimerisation domain-containing protein n=1 Tax=Puccinia striiformis TaxID=27350 RepID=A0A2S4UCC8_9BASI|nr:hypothetical protein PSHT_15939 [Puccinia striiformis]
MSSHYYNQEHHPMQWNQTSLPAMFQLQHAENRLTSALQCATWVLSQLRLTPVNPNIPKRGQKETAVTDHGDKDGSSEVDGNDIATSVVTQVSKRTRRQVDIDLVQDSDEDNRKAAAVKRPKDKTKDQDGFDHVLLYSYPPGGGPKQAPDSLAHACQWCPKEYMATNWSTYNLKMAEVALEAIKDAPALSGTLTAYTSKGRFDNSTLNCLLVIWMMQQSLPWLRIEDFHLRVSMDHALHNSSLLSRTWAASQAHQLYLEQQIQESKLMLSLVSDVWTTKGSRMAFKFHWDRLLSYHQGMETTNSGSNSFTMAKAVAAKFRATDHTTWDVGLLLLQRQPDVATDA